ncbi:DNA-binding transcriptional regulator, PadR family [Micromonospora phaseoli]|uniref:DNA-binding transcriptional regulator, PadR family n=1 Tax=Micromonospora phaseoli TaxID=1144548 RepID=A0A1H6S1Z6_9ACTN|nr:PadR family transcriptional regulator [Micromonospora phaseoli]PZW03720.1 DNA-binding PadR family transcriptional regulator [Micromonospora phaseoli]GIJ80295.1 PadR family transcriptional regulator [Micromonospora phaseoli]SEI60706.1 DNA-binding transcriptional regulator, PadR family [Micromonospora phaseoli]
MERRRRVPNPLALAVLAWLLWEPMHPYELGRRLKQTGKDRHIRYTRSSLYMVIEQLTRAGFVAPQETVRDSARPERTVYAITDEGRHEVHDWLRALLAQPREEYPHFAVALSLLSLLPPDEAVEVLRRRSAALAGRIEETRTTMDDARADGVAWIFLVEEQYALALLEAERRFVAELVESLKQPDYAQSWQETMGGRT